jgi:ribosomal protein S18 acetylase RimI-like enzyme
LLGSRSLKMTNKPREYYLSETERQIEVKEAEMDHAAAMGEVHVLVWQETYTGQMPASFLASLDPARRAEMWSKAIAENAPHHRILVATLDEELVGFVSYGRGRVKELEGAGEIYALNLVKRAQGLGIGSRLFDAAREHLKAMGYDKKGLWVLDTNYHAIQFYQRKGATDSGQRGIIQIGGVGISETLMTF